MYELLKVKNKIEAEDNFLVISHINPDGDSIGSMVAVGHLLASYKKNYFIVLNDNVPEKYNFLLKGLPLTKTIPPKVNWTVLVLDSGDLSRLGSFEEYVQNFEIINIDHHISNIKFGTINYVDFNAAATGEIIFSLLELFNFNIKEDTASALYTAISTDTGNFKYDNTTYKTFEILSKLMRTGFNLRNISSKIYDEKSLASLLLIKESLQTLKFSENGKIAWMEIDDELINNCEALDEDLDGLINYTINIKDVEIGLLFRIEKAREIKIGFRSKNVDVSAIASIFGGGGHKKAAGCSIAGNYKEVKSKVFQEINRYLK